MRYQGTKINPTHFHPSQIRFYMILIPISLFMLLPIIFIINQAFKPLDELFMFPPRFFVKQPSLINFRDLMRTASTTGVPMTRYFFNSIIVTIVTVVLNMYISVMGAYALSKKKFRLRKTLFSINQMALMFVPIAVIVPRYLVIVYTGLNNRYLAHILYLLAMPVGLFLLKQFIDQIPDSMVEAAKLDGANDFQTLRKVIIPLVRPAMATVGILTFQIVWNSRDSSNFYVTDETLKTLAFYLGAFVEETGQSAGQSIAGAGMAAAASLIMFVPNLIIFIIMQSRVMNTMVHSGIK